MMVLYTYNSYMIQKALGMHMRINASRARRASNLWKLPWQMTFLQGNWAWLMTFLKCDTTYVRTYVHVCTQHIGWDVDLD